MCSDHFLPELVNCVFVYVKSHTLGCFFTTLNLLTEVSFFAMLEFVNLELNNNTNLMGRLCLISSVCCSL